MSEQLSIAAVGLGAYARRCLEAFVSCGNVKLVAVCDSDAMTAEQVGRDLGVEHFSDARQMLLTRLVKHSPAAVFLAAPPMHAGEILELCAENGVHVLKGTPLARNLGEAVKFVRMFDSAGLKLCVATQRRFVGSYRKADEFKMKLGNVFLARAHYLFNWGGPLGWRADIKSSGGGAMLEVGYHVVDLLTWMLGLPENVYGVTSRSTTPTVFGIDESAKNYHETDDTACAAWRYKDDRMVTISATRINGPASEEIALHGRDGSVISDYETCRLRDVNGSVLEVVNSQTSPLEIYRDMMRSFAGAVISGAEKYECSAGENLLNHAVIEASYLSSRTGQPESPLDQLQIHAMTPRECLKRIPAEDDK